MENKEEAQITIKEEVVESKPEISLEGLLPQEKEMAVKHGLVPKEGEADVKHVEQSVVKSDEVSEEKEKEVEEDKPTFDEALKAEERGDNSVVDKYNKHEKGLYKQYKHEQVKRKDIQRKYEEAIANKELDSIKDKVAQQRIKKAVELLKDPNQELTVEKLLAVIGDETEDSDDKKTVTIADLKKFEEDKLRIQKDQEESKLKNNERADNVKNIGLEKNEKFIEIVKLASEVAESKKYYADMVEKAFKDTSIDEDELVDIVINIAKLNPKFKDLDSKESASTESNKNVERAIINSSKKTSSAAVGGSKSIRIIPESQLTLEDVSKLSNSEYAKLKKETRERLKML